jgi:hypothetical protein
MHQAQELCHGEESSWKVRVGVFSSEGFPIFNSFAISLTPNLRSERTKVRTFSTLANVLCVFSCPFLGSYCTISRPSLNRLQHSKTHDTFIAYLPKVNVNMTKVSLPILLLFTQNWMFIRCSRLSFHFYRGYVLFHRWRWVCQPYASATLYSPGTLFSASGTHFS